jgi:hypothetical protein
MNIKFGLDAVELPCSTWADARKELRAAIDKVQTTVSDLTMVQALYRSTPPGRSRADIVKLALKNLPAPPSEKLQKLADSETEAEAEPEEAPGADDADGVVASKGGRGQGRGRGRGKAKASKGG